MPPSQPPAEEGEDSSSVEDFLKLYNFRPPPVRVPRQAAAADTRDFEPLLRPGRFVFREALHAPMWGERKKPRQKKYLKPWRRDYHGYEWRLMYFPYGNPYGIAPQEHALSVYLEINPASSVSATFRPLAACAGAGLVGATADDRVQRL
jgi:hypothetical protein